jgi:Fic family protein
MPKTIATLTRESNMDLSIGLICDLHKMITQQIDYSNNTPGEYRTIPVRTGNYQPPPPNQVKDLMDQFIYWFNSIAIEKWEPIICAIIAHFYLVSIHPFGDGNGRASRAVESFLLFQSGINARGFYSLSNYYYNNRSNYIQMLDSVRFETDGNLTPFIVFALTGLLEELTSIHKEILSEVKWIAFKDYSRETLSRNNKLTTKSGDRMFHFLLMLGSKPIPIKNLKLGQYPQSGLYRHVTERTLARDIKFLKEHNLITIDKEGIAANLAVMERFTAPLELQRKKQQRVEQ